MIRGAPRVLTAPLTLTLALSVSTSNLAVSKSVPTSVLAAALAPGHRIVVDDFEDVSRWSAHPASGVELAIRSDAGVHGRAMRLDFSFSGGGYAVARRELSLDLPENYRLRFAVRGACLPNDLELKLIDSSGEKVWWHNRRGFVFPARWDSLSTRKRHVTFAWGPTGGGEIRHVAAIEIAVTAGQGGRGSVWLDDFTLEGLAPTSAAPPAPRATASSGAAPRAVDGIASTSWESGPSDLRPWLALDLGVEREFGGLVIDWLPGRHAGNYEIELSDDGAAWRVVRQVNGANGGRDYLRLPESEARHVRVHMPGPVRSRSFGIRELSIQPLEWGATPERFYQAIARDAPRGLYPRAILGEQPSWTVVGIPGDRDEGLVDTDGALETGKAQFSIEPFLFTGGRLVTWADAASRRWLEDGSLPIPSVAWRTGELELVITVLPRRDFERSGLWARYRVVNHGARPALATLFLAVRPFQVNPPSQFLNTPGGTARVREIAGEGRIVRVNRERGLTSLTEPSGFGAASFDQGDLVADYLRDGRLPPGRSVRDPEERASAALAYRLDVAPNAHRDVVLFVPLRGGPPEDEPHSEQAASSRFVRYLERATEDARADLAPVKIVLPEPAREVERTLKAQLGWIQINRDGPVIQPGSRSYERSWIRDGSLTSSALLRLGHPAVVREFMEWFAGYQYPDGKVPCCVDQRGADPVPEHDSHGELIFLVAEYYRYTGDRAAVERLWPRVLGAAAYLDSLRHERRGAEWRAPDKRHFFGLLPPSISHEGYSAKPMHSYWDDFLALRGFKDAAYLAGVLGRAADQARLSASRDEFGSDLGASIRAAMAKHKIDYVPGCADLGDFDATSTTIALAPAEAEGILPKGALERTFERYWEFFRDRRDGKKPWEAFTPYEVRTIGAFVRLGWRDRANELLEYFLAHRNPPEWAQWAEVVWKDIKTPHFIGDLPHTWVGSDFVRSVLDMLAYEREADSALVVGAGVPREWLVGTTGIEVRALPTPYGKLGYSMHADNDNVVVRVEAGIRLPPGGIVVSPPPPERGSYSGAIVDGRRSALSGGTWVVARELPATIVFRRQR